jgi:hypothetical protein
MSGNRGLVVILSAAKDLNQKCLVNASLLAKVLRLRFFGRRGDLRMTATAYG